MMGNNAYGCGIFSKQEAGLKHHLVLGPLVRLVHPGTHRPRQDAIPSLGNGFQGVISVPHHEICHITHFPVFALAISRSPQLTYCNSISTSAQYVTLDNKIEHLSFSFLFLGNPTNKIVTRTAYTWELQIANHLDE
jgi:hypothetical protein